MRSFILLLCLLTALFKTNLAEAYSRTAEHKPGFTKDKNLPAALHDGQHFFIREHALAGQPSQAEIDAAMAASVAQGRIIQVTTGGLNIPSLLKEITSLPVVFRSRISGHDYDIVIMGMRFTPTGATLSMGCRFTLPGNALPGNALPDSQTNLYFGSNDIAVSGKSGFAGDLPILKTSLGDTKSAELDDPGKLLGGQTSFAEFALPGFGSSLTMGLGADSKLSFTCGAFNTFSLSGFVKAYNLVEKETADGKKVADAKPLLLVFTGQQTSDWKDIFIDAKVASAFHAASYPDLGFHFGSDNLAKIDLSMLRNPANLPSCAQVSAESWQGIAFPTFKLRLPAFFKLRSAATLAMGNVAPATGKNLFMDAEGLLGSVGAENVYTLKEGYTDEINKYDMSLDNLTANYSCNGQVTASMLGKIAMPWCGENSKSDAPLLRYGFRYTNNRYEVFVKDTEQGNYGSGPYLLSTGSQLAFNVTDSKFLIQTKSTEKPVISADVYGNSVCRDFPAKLSASQCTDKALIWSTGASGASLEVKPAVTTTYTVKCQDKYCVSASSDSLKITVYESLPKPALIAGRDAFCRYESTDLSADNCVGKIEWKNPGGGSFDGSGADQRVQHASFSNVNQATDFTYLVRCNLNGCLSPETAKTLRVNPEPAAPNLYSNAPNNTIDKNGSVTIGGNCANGDRLVWENLPPDGVPQSTVTLASTTSYAAICRNDATGCQSLSKSSITINVLYFPPAAPTNLAFSGAGTNFLTLTWQDNSGNEDGFTILRSTSPTFANAQTVGNVGADITSFHDNNLTEGITYYYQVISHNRYDNGYSDWASRSTVITPGAPELRADNQNIVKGTAARVSGYCPVGNLVWTVPVGYGRGERVQYENTTYWAKCVNEGVEGRGGSITVSVYVPTPGAPELSASSTNIVKGGKVNVTGTCASGTLVWTVPVGYGGGERTQNETTTYWAKCVNDGVESGGSSITVSVYVPTPGAPQLSASNTSIVKGSKANVFGTCPSGTLVWTAPVGFGGGEWLQQDNVTYWAKCVNEGFESEGVSITVAVYEQPKAPQPSLRADKNPANPGENTVVYADGCDGTITWSTGATGHTIWTGAGTYWATCSKPGYQNSDAGFITINTITEQPKAPQPSLRADKNPVNPGENTVVYADGCDGTVTWSTGATGNTIWTGAGTYWATCSKPGYQNSDAGFITINIITEQPKVAQPSLRADKNPVNPGENTVVYADGCDGTVTWSTGATGNTIWTGAGTYWATCSKPGYQNSDAGFITINIITEQPKVAQPSLRADKNPVNPGENTVVYADGCDGTITWSTGATGNTIWTGAGTYWATCSKPGYQNSDAGFITVNTIIELSKAPQPTLRADKPSLKPGENTVVYADGCDGTITWSTGATGNTIWTGAGSYWAICSKPGYQNSDAGYLTIPVDNTPTEPSKAPQPTLRADKNSLKPGENTVVYADGCDGTITWSTGATGNAIWTGAGSYWAICSKPGYQNSDAGYLTIPVDNTPTEPSKAPQPTLRADKNSLKPGENTVVYADGCDGTITWSTGATGNTIWTGAGSYWAICSKPGYQNSDPGYITIPGDSTPVEPSKASKPKLRADKPSLKPGENTVVYADGCDGTITWSTGATGNTIWTGAGSYWAICSKPGYQNSDQGYITIPQDNTQTCTNPPSPSLSGPGTVDKNQSFSIYLSGCAGARYVNNVSQREEFFANGDSELIFNGTISSDTEFKVECFKDGCPRVSASKMVQVSAPCTPPNAPVVSAIDEIESNQDFTIAAIGCSSGSTFNWSHTGTPTRISTAPRGVGSSGLITSITSDTDFYVSCVQNGCESPVGHKAVRIKKLVDETPNWQPTAIRCNNSGVLYKDMNSNSRTSGQTKCVGGIQCVTYTITVYDGSNQYSDKPDTCGSCVVYTDCYGAKKVGSFSGMAYGDTYKIDAQENSITCNGCSSAASH